jgi:hypothetical protein
MVAAGMAHSVSPRARGLFPEFSAFGNCHTDKTSPLAIRPTTYSGIWILAANLKTVATMQLPYGVSEFQEPRGIVTEDHLALRAGQIDLFD